MSARLEQEYQYQRGRADMAATFATLLAQFRTVEEIRAFASRLDADARKAAKAALRTANRDRKADRSAAL